MASKRYTGDGVDVTFDADLCIHAARCVRGLPEVFDTSRRPWVQPGNAGVDAVMEVVARCPTGALRTQRNDGGAQEAPDAGVTITEVPDGPLEVRGPVRVLDATGSPIVAFHRIALCRCGASRNRPFCDGSHHRVGFTA